MASTIDPVDFKKKFGADLESLPNLIEKKTITINRLLDVLPPGTVNPSQFLQN